MITDVPGLRVGHWTDPLAQTGCTVVLFPEGTVASAEVRGGAPAEREVALLDPSRLVQQIDALVLTGGSAFGLASADGVMRFCEEHERGVVTPGGRVPIVVALGLFDLAVGDAGVRPGPEEGRAACLAAGTGPVELGRVGAGTGAMVDGIAMLAGGEPRPGGLVSATVRHGDLVVSSLVAVNAFGMLGGDDSETTASELTAHMDRATPFGNTTIGMVATNAELDKMGCFLLAQAAHDGLARAIFPSHTRLDGDTFVAASVGGVKAEVDTIRPLAISAVAQALRSLA